MVFRISHHYPFSNTSKFQVQKMSQDFFAPDLTDAKGKTHEWGTAKSAFNKPFLKRDQKFLAITSEEFKQRCLEEAFKLEKIPPGSGSLWDMSHLYHLRVVPLKDLPMEKVIPDFEKPLEEGGYLSIFCCIYRQHHELMEDFRTQRYS
jgi:hypothetical protein